MLSCYFSPGCFYNQALYAITITTGLQSTLKYQKLSVAFLGKCFHISKSIAQKAEIQTLGEYIQREQKATGGDIEVTESNSKVPEALSLIFRKVSKIKHQ